MKGKKLVIALMVFALACAGVGLGIHLLHKDAKADEFHTIKIRCNDCQMDLNGKVRCEVETALGWEDEAEWTGADGLHTFEFVHVGDRWKAILIVEPDGHDYGGSATQAIFYEDHGFTFFVNCN